MNVHAAEDADLPEALASLCRYALSEYDFVVGPHTEKFLRRSFGIGPADPVSAPRVRALLAKFYALAYPALSKWFLGFTIHDAEHGGCEAAKIDEVRHSMLQTS